MKKLTEEKKMFASFANEQLPKRDINRIKGGEDPPPPPPPPPPIVPPKSGG